MTIKAVIFDLDDTLYNEKQFMKSGFKAVSGHIAEKYGIDEKEFYRLLLSIFSRRRKKNVFDLALKKFNLYKKETILEMMEVYRNHFPNITIYADAQRVLAELKKKYRTGLITGGIKKVQKSKVEALNISDFFDVITYAVEHGGKNDIQAFLITLERLKVKPSDSVYTIIH